MPSIDVVTESGVNLELNFSPSRSHMDDHQVEVDVNIDGDGDVIEIDTAMERSWIDRDQMCDKVIEMLPVITPVDSLKIRSEIGLACDRWAVETAENFKKADNKLEAFKIETAENFKKADDKLESFKAETAENFKKADDKLESFKAETKENFKKADDKLESFKAETKENFQDVNSKLDLLINHLINIPNLLKK